MIGNLGVLQWIYIFNFIFVMMHEYDGAYWKEWQMFGEGGAALSDKKGLTVFNLLRIPLGIPLLYGLLNLDKTAGLIISLIFGVAMIAHFFLHMIARKQGDEKFAWPISYFIQFGLLALSIIQILLTLKR
jgi:hypothetical protein